MAGELEIAKGVKTTTNVPVDSWYGPYSSLADARAALPVTMRLYRTVGIIENGEIAEYNWKSAMGDNDLVKKQDKGFIFHNTVDDGIYFDDTRSVKKGIEYTGNYRTSFSNRSLADWGNVISQIGGQAIDTLLTTPGTDQNGFVITWNNANLEYELKEVVGKDAVFPASAVSGRIAFVNNVGNGLIYSSKFFWNDATNSLLAAGNGSTISGTDNANFGSGTALTGRWSITCAEESVIRGGNSLSSGWFHEVGSGVSFSGNATFTTGTDNKNYGVGSYAGGIGSKVNHMGASQRGGFVHCFQVGSVNGLKPGNVEYLLINDGAFNVSRNTSSQLAGHGAMAQDSAILAGVDHNIPSDSFRSVILGGNGIKARAAEPDQVYVPNLNIASQPLSDDTLVHALVRDNITGQIKRRDANLLAGKAVDATLTSPGAGQHGHIVSWNNTNLEYELVPQNASTVAYPDVDINPPPFVSDFYSNEVRVGFTSFNAGGGLGTTGLNTTGANNIENALGVAFVGTSNSTAGGGTIHGGSSLIRFGLGYTINLKWRCALQTLSDDTDSYKGYIGFSNSLGAGDASNGAYFRYSHNVNGGRWEAVVANAGVVTAYDTQVLADISVFHVFEIRSNASGSQVDFYIDGNLTNSITVDIPTGFFTFHFKIEKTAGNGSRIIYADYVQFLAQRSTTR